MCHNEDVGTDMPRRIGVSGKARSGKDTLAGYLVDRYGFVRFAFADRLRELAVELFGVKAGDKNRALLQALGRRMCELDRMVWVNRVLKAIPHDRDVVVSDVRFPYEYAALRDAGFFMVRVEAPFAVRLARERRDNMSATAAELQRMLVDDISETALDTVGGEAWDVVFSGGLPLPDFYRRVDAMLPMLAVRA